MINVVPINVEKTFTDFVRTFRDGKPLVEFCASIPPGVKNADFYFPSDNVIAELKTLEVDAFEPDAFGKRVMTCYKQLGYELSDYISWLSRESNFPVDVSRRLFGMLSRPIIDCIKTAGKQITASR